MAIAFVNSAVRNTGSGSTSTVTYSSTTGNTLIAVCAADLALSADTYSSGCTVTDTASNTWTVSAGLATSPPTIWENGITTPLLLFIGYCLNATHVTSVTAGINASATSDNTFVNVVVAEFSGCGSFDVGNTLAGTLTNTPPAASLTLSGTNELIIAAVNRAGGFNALPSGFTSLDGFNVGYALNQNGSFSGNFGDAANIGQPYLAASAAFKPPGAPPPSGGLLLSRFP